MIIFARGHVINFIYGLSLFLKSNENPFIWFRNLALPWTNLPTIISSVMFLYALAYALKPLVDSTLILLYSKGFIIMFSYRASMNTIYFLQFTIIYFSFPLLPFFPSFPVIIKTKRNVIEISKNPTWNWNSNPRLLHPLQKCR